MASTRLQRKARRNKSRAKKKVADIQRLNQKPVIKNVDIEEIKKGFSKSGSDKSASAEATGGTRKADTKAEKAEKPVAEKAKAEKAEAKKSEKSEAPKKEAVAEAETNEVDVDALLKSVGKADASSKDDLKQINGIGPAFEKKLNEIGLFTFEQISKLKKKDIQNLGNMDGLSAEKIESDNWVAEAKNYMEANKGE